jgi:hypothetical protein
VKCLECARSPGTRIVALIARPTQRRENEEKAKTPVGEEGLVGVLVGMVVHKDVESAPQDVQGA